MTQDLIVLTSITYAYKAQKILEKSWIKCTVIRTPEKYSNKGCGYSLALKTDTEKAAEILKESGIRVVQVVRGASF